ncbi:MAG TPA: hypothetical protein VKM54_10055 [Myxococcota bacterium]|nr:hypothetical protein [Myxococcota bacterium]
MAGRSSTGGLLVVQGSAKGEPRTFGADELDRLLLDPKALSRTGLVPAEHATALLAAGAVELGRLGDRVLVRRRAS